MRYGKISATLLAIAGLTIVCMMLLMPGWGNPLATLGGLLIMPLLPGAVIIGVMGIINDEPKALAIVATCGASGLILLYVLVFVIGFLQICRWADKSERTGLMPHHGPVLP